MKRSLWMAMALVAGITSALPAHADKPRWGGNSRISFEDRETIYRRDGWTRVRLDVNDRGSRLYLDVNGRMQIDYAEVVFENGRSRVIDFRNSPRTGMFELVTLQANRGVDHVTLRARARSGQATATLKLEGSDSAWNDRGSGRGRDSGEWGRDGGRGSGERGRDGGWDGDNNDQSGRDGGRNGDNNDPRGRRRNGG